MGVCSFFHESMIEENSTRSNKTTTTGFSSGSPTRRLEGRKTYSPRFIHRREADDNLYDVAAISARNTPVDGHCSLKNGQSTTEVLTNDDLKPFLFWAPYDSYRLLLTVGLLIFRSKKRREYKIACEQWARKEGMQTDVIITLLNAILSLIISEMPPPVVRKWRFSASR